MTTFRVPDNVLPDLWDDLRPPGKVMTEQDLLENIHAILTPISAITSTLQIALEQNLTPLISRPVVTTIDEALTAVVRLLDAWWQTAHPAHNAQAGRGTP